MKNRVSSRLFRVMVWARVRRRPFQLGRSGLEFRYYTLVGV